MVSPINTDSEGNAFTITTRYSAMCSGNVCGGGHYPMTAVEESSMTTDNNIQYRIRKLTQRECYRLMGVDDSDIDKVLNATTTKRLKNGTEKIVPTIADSQHYKLAGNSIVVDVLFHIFRTMFIPDQPENKQKTPIQLSLF